MAGLRTKLYHLDGSPKLSNNPVRVTFFLDGVAYDVKAKLQATIVSTNAAIMYIHATSFELLLILTHRESHF